MCWRTIISAGCPAPPLLILSLASPALLVDFDWWQERGGCPCMCSRHWRTTDTAPSMPCSMLLAPLAGTDPEGVHRCATAAALSTFMLVLMQIFILVHHISYLHTR
eukprot:364757-Chlamydomonas_euryale.AAC.13